MDAYRNSLGVQQGLPVRPEININFFEPEGLGNIAFNGPYFKEYRRVEKERLENHRKLEQLRAFLLEKLNEARAILDVLEIRNSNYSKPEYMGLRKWDFKEAAYVFTDYQTCSTNRIKYKLIPTVLSITDEVTYQIARERLILEIEKIGIYGWSKAHYGWSDEDNKRIVRFYPYQMLVKFQEIQEIVNEIRDALQIPVAGGRRRNIKTRKTRKSCVRKTRTRKSRK